MHITRVNADLLQLPLPRPRCLPRAEQSGSSPEYVTVLLVVLDTDEGLTGLGFAYDCEAVRFHGRILRTVVEDALAPQLIGADPRSYERLYTQLRRNVTPGGNAALAAVDIGVWDLAAKAAGLPLWRFLGGARDAATAYTAETAWPTLGGEQIVALYEAAKANGISGLQVAVGGLSPEADARRLESIRNEIGLDAWLGVSANGVYDAGTALAMGRFLEEEMDADWFEDPVPTDDRAGLRRLADKLEMPVAAGRGFERVSQFTDWLTDAAAGVLRPNPVRLGGLTPTVRVMHLAEAFHRPAAPVLLPEVGVHLACGLPGVRAVDHVSWLAPLWDSPPIVTGGTIAPGPGTGLGLELSAGAVDRFRVRP